MSVRSCSEIALVQGCERQRTQANISGLCFSGGTSGGTFWSGPAVYEGDLDRENDVLSAKLLELLLEQTI